MAYHVDGILHITSSLLAQGNIICGKECWAFSVKTAHSLFFNCMGNEHSDQPEIPLNTSKHYKSVHGQAIKNPPPSI